LLHRSYLPTPSIFALLASGSVCYPSATPLETLLKDCRLKVLSLSTDQELSQLRQTILEAAGNEVVSLLNEKEALATAQSSEDFDVVLLCHRFPSATARQVVRLLRQHHPDARIVYIVHVYGEWPEVEADRYIVGADGPQALVRVLEEVHA
jgi:CheY-like chemotaxis protein